MFYILEFKIKDLKNIKQNEKKNKKSNLVLFFLIFLF